jgi:hypothetical protein
MAVKVIHGRVEIVFIEGFTGLQAAGLSQPGALRFLSQRQLGAGKEQAAVDEGLQEAPLPGRTQAGQELAQPKARPGVVEDRQAAVIQSLMQMHLISRQEVQPFEGCGDEIAGVGRQIGDIADGAGTGTVGGAKGLANQIGDVGFAILAGGGSGLDEHGLQTNNRI